MKKIVVYTALIGIFTFTLARAEPAHQHGVANVNIVISKQMLIIELDTPADNVLGFEHEPRTEQEKQDLSNSLLLLKQADSLFTFPSSAKCKIRQVDIGNPFASDKNDKGHHKETDNEHHLEAQDKHAEDMHEEHGTHEEHEEHGTHSDFEILYTYDCQQPSQLHHINMAGLFKHFPGFITLKVQWVNENRQSAVTVTKKADQVNFNE